jgi:hypothetical protein
MLLQCETEKGAAACGAGAAAAWLRPAMLASLSELNEACFALLTEQAAARGVAASALLRTVSELWSGLDAAARRRAAGVPYLLIDAGFAEPLRWRGGADPQVGDTQMPYTAFFTVPAVREVARWVFTYAWHLARSEGPAARLLLGLPAPTALLISRYTVRQIQALAESHAGWLKPRWPGRVQAWRELLQGAAGGDSPAFERARRRGVSLLAAEARLQPARPLS